MKYFAQYLSCVNLQFWIKYHFSNLNGNETQFYIDLLSNVLCIWTCRFKISRLQIWRHFYSEFCISSEFSFSLFNFSYTFSFFFYFSSIWILLWMYATLVCKTIGKEKGREFQKEQQENLSRVCAGRCTLKVTNIHSSNLSRWMKAAIHH